MQMLVAGWLAGIFAYTYIQNNHNNNNSFCFSATILLHIRPSVGRHCQKAQKAINRIIMTIN